MKLKSKPREKARFRSRYLETPALASAGLGSKAQKYSERVRRVELRKNKPKSTMTLDEKVGT